MRFIREEINIDTIELFVAEARLFLTGIKGYSDLLAIGMAGPLLTEQQEMIRQIQQRVDGLQELCSQVLLEALETRDHRRSGLEEQDDEK